MIVCGKIISMIEGDADRHHLVLDDNGQILGRLGDVAVAKKAELELHEKMETMVAEKGVDYIDAFRAVSNDPKNVALVQCYAGETADRLVQDTELEMSSQAAGEEVHRRSTTYMAEHDNADYQAAVRMVLVADPTLKVAYGQL